MGSLPKRFPRELANVQSEDMRSCGIYYVHDDVNALKGKAMVVGPTDTPYAFCPLVFDFEFPSDYPFHSPKVRFVTSDGVSRFHPNLYVEGKVCLSILGTWKGPEWSGAMTISTVLSSIQSLLEANPITNEPGFEKYTLETPRAKQYAEMVRFRLAAFTIRKLMQIKMGHIPEEWKPFEDVFVERGGDLFTGLLSVIEEYAALNEVEGVNLPYSMSGVTKWKELEKEIKAMLKLEHGTTTLKDTGK